MTSVKYTLTAEHATKCSTPYAPPSPNLRTASDSALCLAQSSASSTSQPNLLRRSPAYWDLTTIPPETSTTATITLVLVPTTLIVPAAPSETIRRVALTIDTLGTVGMLKQEVSKVIADEASLERCDSGVDDIGEEEEVGRKSVVLWHNGGVLEDREFVWECEVKEGDEVRVVYEPVGGEVRRSGVGVKELVAIYPSA